MDDEGEGVPPRLSNRFGDTATTASSSSGVGDGEVDFKTKIGTAWSHNFLNQKPWHPLSYRNQRRKWIAEQTHGERVRRSEEVKREFAQEQEFLRQTALVSSKKEKEKMELMKAVSFMYVRPPGYNPESAKAAEIADEQSRNELGHRPDVNPSSSGTALLSPGPESNSNPGRNKMKDRAKDVFGRPLPTEEEFEVLKNAPRLETGVPVRVKPFAIEIRNVKCVRCGAYGHQSGDRECPLKDVIMPNDENRLKRDDPLTAINAQTGCSEPLKWELKQRPGMSPPRGGFRPDDPNQQIVAEDIFDEYGGFLSGGDIPDLLATFSKKPRKHHTRKHRHKERLSSGGSKTRDSRDGSHESSSSDYDTVKKWRKSKYKHMRTQSKRESTVPDSPESQRKQREERPVLTTSDSDGGSARKNSKMKLKESRYVSKSEHDNAITSKANFRGKRKHSNGSSSSDDHSGSCHNFRVKKHRKTKHKYR